jgi:hypothetical protein
VRDWARANPLSAEEDKHELEGRYRHGDVVPTQYSTLQNVMPDFSPSRQVRTLFHAVKAARAICFRLWDPDLWFAKNASD